MAAPLSFGEWMEEQSRLEALRRHPLLLTLIFLIVFFVLQYLWQLCLGGTIEHFVIDWATVAPAAWLLHAIFPHQMVTALGHSLVSPAGRLTVVNGCEGVETMLLLSAAFIAFPFGWKARIGGLLSGVLLVYLINQVRLVILWQVWVDDRDLFGLMHGTVLPLVIIAVCLLYFLWFINRHDLRRQELA